LYLTGLNKIYNHAKSGNDLNVLLTGKVTLEYKDIIEKMQGLGLAKPSKHYTDAYLTNNNSNKNFDFILNSLKLK
jgi:hypothetical protein